MAINGKLGDIGFVELLKMVSKRTGKLSINTPQNQRYDWFIHELRVFAVRINQEPVKRQEIVEETALQLINDEESMYSFVGREELDKFPIEMSFNLEQIISEALRRLTSTAPSRKHFPNPVTKFEAVPNISHQLTGDALLLWKRAEYFFFTGTSAAEIASELKMKLDDVRMEFYRWRIMGMITPVRVFSAIATQLPPTNSEGSQWQSKQLYNSPTAPTPILNNSPTAPTPILNNSSTPPTSILNNSSTPPTSILNNSSTPPTSILNNSTTTDEPPPQNAPPQRILYSEGRSRPQQYKPYVEKPKNNERQTLIRRMLGALFRK